MSAIVSPERLRTAAEWAEPGVNMAEVTIEDAPAVLSDRRAPGDVLVTEGDASIQVANDASIVGE
ncbi:MAG: hypothetical protein KDB58_04185 [Solirubrobacterales bacterium]|nr:hypothetical protein [Solirubrobacterales bacterium]MCB8971007.1 hypothetical protein [Thermoleophilales bacterium]MCO5326099.1 hypothetical protein [Solirubrobacterales bacterium]